MGRGVARIDYESMDSLSASTGDVIEIRGKRRTVAKCLPLYPSDEGKGIIRVDGLVRNNAGVAIGDTVVVRKIKAVPAEKVIVAPLEAIPQIDERYLADALESVPLIKGDNVMVPYFGGRLTFQVIGVTPAAAEEAKKYVSKAKRGEICVNSIKTYMMGIQSFLEFHEIALPWKKISRFYPPEIANNLRAYTKEEIIKILSVDLRSKI